MKAKTLILIFIMLLLVSCVPETPMQESPVDVVEVVAEAPVTEVSATQEPAATEELVATEQPTKTSTQTPIACVALLTPVNGVEIPPVGKVTFSWTPMDEAGKYVLNIILPSGLIVPFETDQTFRDRYMEAFSIGGEYQWQVIAQDPSGSEFCVSEVFTFNKPAYENPNSGDNGNDSGGGSGDDGGGEVSCEDTPAGCGFED